MFMKGMKMYSMNGKEMPRPAPKTGGPKHERTQNEHGWFWTMMHKSVRHH